jgi:site-specific DNA-methyltransferase (adenine-specific)
MDTNTHTAQAHLYEGDAFDVLRSLPDESVDSVITDPPYFLDKLDHDWDVPNFTTSSKGGTVKSLPIGMKFDSQQGRSFQTFMHDLSLEVLRVLKPGGAYVAMSAPRLYHRLGVAVEDAGFEVRDMWAWLYTQNQVKAMSVERFINENELSPEQLAVLRAELAQWKTPQIKSCIEPAVFAQKPKLDKSGRPVTFLQNWLDHHIGLLNIRTGVGVGGEMLSVNVVTTGPISEATDRAFLVTKPTKKEKGETSHLSVKPLSLMEQYIRITTPVGGVVLDPFNGSGSTGIAALNVGCDYVGVELSPVYFAESATRFEEALGDDFAWDRRTKNPLRGRLRLAAEVTR